jgi:hypothetical protein
MEPTKRKRGRPRLADAARLEPVTVWVPPVVADWMRATDAATIRAELERLSKHESAK